MTVGLSILDAIPHNRREFDRPDLAQDIKTFANNIQDDLKGITQDDYDFKYHTDNLDSIAGEIKSYAEGSEISNLIEYIDKLEHIVDTMGDALIGIARKAVDIQDQVLSVDAPLFRDDLVDLLADLRERAAEPLDCYNSFFRTMQTRGWSQQNIETIQELMGHSQEWVELLEHKSVFRDVYVGVKGKMFISGSTITYTGPGVDYLQVEQKHGTLVFKVFQERKVTVFDFSQMKDIFLNILRPTDDELLAYEMFTGKKFTIREWRDTFGKEDPRKSM